MAEELLVCVTCEKPIRKINYALGEKWMHIVPEAGFPTERAGTAWEYCKLSRANPGEDVNAEDMTWDIDLNIPTYTRDYLKLQRAGKLNDLVV